MTHVTRVRHTTCEEAQTALSAPGGQVGVKKLLVRILTLDRDTGMCSVGDSNNACERGENT